MKISRVVAADARIQLLTDGGLHCTQPFLAFNLPKRNARLSPAQTGNSAWGVPIFSTTARVEKQRKLNNIQELQLWKLSQPLRKRFSWAQIERGGTVCVSVLTTKMGASFDAPCSPSSSITLGVRAIRLFPRLRRGRWRSRRLSRTRFAFFLCCFRRRILTL